MFGAHSLLFEELLVWLVFMLVDKRSVLFTGYIFQNRHN